MEDSRNALFVEPNAYIQHFNKKEKGEVKPIKKVVFSEPYDCMPTYHINNDFEIGCCDCIDNAHLKNCNCDNKNKNRNQDCNCNKNKQCNNNHPNFNFDIKSLMPLLSGLNKGGSGFDFNSISSLFSNNGGFDFSKLLSNPDLIKNVLSMFGGKKKTINHKEDVVCTDYEIKNYTKVK